MCFLVGEKISTTTPLTQQKLFSPGELNLKPASGYYSDLTSVYQGEDQGKGCYFTIIDTLSARK
jgi:hypothetical protein